MSSLTLPIMLTITAASVATVGVATAAVADVDSSPQEPALALRGPMTSEQSRAPFRISNPEQLPMLLAQAGSPNATNGITTPFDDSFGSLGSGSSGFDSDMGGAGSGTAGSDLGGLDSSGSGASGGNAGGFLNPPGTTSSIGSGEVNMDQSLGQLSQSLGGPDGSLGTIQDMSGLSGGSSGASGSLGGIDSLGNPATMGGGAPPAGSAAGQTGNPSVPWATGAGTGGLSSFGGLTGHGGISAEGESAGAGTRGVTSGQAGGAHGDR